MPVPTTLEAPPDQTSHNVARPLFGRTVASFANGLNFCAGFKGLRYSQQICDFTGVDIPKSGPQTNDLRLRWVVSPLGRYVWWGAYVVGSASTAAPYLKVYLETPTGFLIDGPIEFTAGDGRLILQQFYTHANHPEYGASMGRDGIVSTGWATSAPTSATPRLLDADGYQGTDVVIRVEVSDARVYTHMALEAYQAEP